MAGERESHWGVARAGRLGRRMVLGKRWVAT